jgi:hypothetical protein
MEKTVLHYGPIASGRYSIATDYIIDINQIAVNLAEQHGREGALSDAYKNRISDLASPHVK